MNGFRILCFFLFLLTSFQTKAQIEKTYLMEKETVGEEQIYHFSDGVSLAFKRPKTLQWVKRIPGNLYDFGKEAFQKKHTGKIAAVLGVTTLMVIYDQQIIDASQRFGNDIGLSGDIENYVPFSLKLSEGFDLGILLPANLNTSFYFLGDGITHLGLSAGMYFWGMAKNDYRAMQTSTQLTEGIVSIGIMTQFLKHITGRQSPFKSTQDGGLWRVFPNQADYSQNVPSYDAFPSGHLATAMVTVTILAENYPEKRYIRPLGYSLMGVLAYSMLNNGVHWISDYPLSIAMGYVVGKVTVARGRRRIVREQNGQASNFQKNSRWTPMYSPNFVGLGWQYSF